MRRTLALLALLTGCYTFKQPVPREDTSVDSEQLIDSPPVDVPTDVFDASDAPDVSDAFDASDTPDAPDAVCADGGYLSDATCVSLGPPRAIAPLSAWFVASARPTLRWALPTGADGAILTLCSDRACTRTLREERVRGTSFTPAAPLSAGVYFWTLRATRDDVTGAAQSPTWEFFVASADLRESGTRGVSADLNGDGLDELIVAAPGALSGAGRVYVYPGSTGSLTARLPITLSDRLAGFGATVAAVGDMNGDGYGDLAVGSPEQGGAVGQVQLFLGAPTGVTMTAVSTTSGSAGVGARFGSSVAAVGDADDDGYGDLLVGAPGASSMAVNTGRAFLYRGTPTRGLDAGALAPFPDAAARGVGRVVAGACDRGVNALLLSAFNTAEPTGRVALTRTPPTSPVIFLGTTPSGFFGASLAARDDLDGDGYCDIAIGAPGASQARIFRGGISGFTTTANPVLTSSGAFGESMSVGDLTQDGAPDLAIGAARRDGGAVYIYAGGAGFLTTTTAHQTLNAPLSARELYGHSLAALRDLNGDGLPDLAVSASNAASGEGRVYVYFGRRGAPLPSTPDVTIAAPDGASSAFGSALGGASPRAQ